MRGAEAIGVGLGEANKRFDFREVNVEFVRLVLSLSVDAEAFESVEFFFLESFRM
jgi:hypothetical protein